MFKRFRKYRLSPEIRESYVDVHLHARDLIVPYFVVKGDGRKESDPRLKGVYQFSVDMLLEDLEETVGLGIDKILLYGLVEEQEKTKNGLYAFKHNSLVEQTIRKIKDRFPGLKVISDVCPSLYTTHGHCGVVSGLKVDNDKTLEVLMKIAESHARAGADYVSPSSMVDGQVHAIRTKLDKRGYSAVKIIAQSAVFASSFNKTFTEFTNSPVRFGDKRTYQVDYRTKNQAIDEIDADISEGADEIMIQPANTYLDIISRAKTKHRGVSFTGYQSAGEYMLLVTGAENGVVDLREAMIESLTAIRRAGANQIVTHYAKELARYLNGDSYYVI